MLNRICILPPIHSHYTIIQKIVWNFNEIYDVKDYFCNYYDKSKTYEFNNIYGCHGKYTFENLKLEKILDIKDKNTTLLTRRNFRTIDDIEELEKLDDNIICKNIYGIMLNLILALQMVVLIVDIIRIS